jgi:hypothetical protein
MNLKEYLEILAYDAAFWLTAFQDPDYSLDQLGEVCVDTCAKLRAAAIIVLLTRAETDGFIYNLMRSARCRAGYLQRLRNAGVSGHHQASGRVAPLLDAIAANDFTVARQIAALSPTTWMQGHEYEDDFCYAQVLHQLVATPLDAAALSALFVRWRAALGGDPDPRLDVAGSLTASDQAGFDSAFGDLLDARAEKIAADKARSQMEDALVISEREVYVEGLAILRLAERFGLRTEWEYRFCPSVARDALTTPFPGE